MSPLGSPIGAVRRLGLGLTLTVVVISIGARTFSDVDSKEASPPSGEPCAVRHDPLDLGAHALDVVPSDRVTLGGGRYRLTASDFLHDGPFDPEVGRTRVVWGPESTTPEYDPGPATVSGATGSVDLEEDVPQVVDLAEGTWWFLNSNGVRLTMEPCAPATAQPDDEP
jgi:hypothetical protein